MKKEYQMIVSKGHKTWKQVLMFLENTVLRKLWHLHSLNALLPRESTFACLLGVKGWLFSRQTILPGAHGQYPGVRNLGKSHRAWTLRTLGCPSMAMTNSFPQLSCGKHSKNHFPMDLFIFFDFMFMEFIQIFQTACLGCKLIDFYLKFCLDMKYIDSLFLL